MIEDIKNNFKDYKQIKDEEFENIKRNFALKVLNIGIWDHDITTNKTNFSEESANILGYTKEELNKDSESWNKLIYKEDEKKYDRDFQDHLLGHKDLYENISRIKHKNGSYRWILDKGKVIEKTEYGTPKKIIGIHVDITESRIKEDTISDSLILITKQNNILKNFAYIASHNLKEHSGNFENLLEFYKEATSNIEKEALIKNMEIVSNSFKKTIDNLRQIVNINSTNNNIVEDIELKSFINNSIDQIMVNNNFRDVTIINNVPYKTIINFSVAYFESIIQNLLSNAIKYSKPNNNTLIEINTHDTKDFIVLKVEDNGIGIDLDTFGQDIFGLYRTFHKNKDAEGIGLYITKNQIESLGGKISVESEVNKGTKFILEFPK